MKPKTLLIFSQTFLPDPAAVGEYMTDVAIAMAARGYRVRVFTSARGYENASVRYARRETLHGVEIHRFPFGSFGKRSMLLRILGTAFFQMQSFLAGLFAWEADGIFFSTSPPLVGVIASVLSVIRRVPIAYWAMDLNPDQLIALGKIKPTSLTAWILETANRLILRRSSLVIVLDRFMADRLEKRMPLANKMLVMPPWPHDAHFAAPADFGGENPFRARHGLLGKFVVMYSGNHSPANPLKTLLDAAVRLKDHPDLHFLFVGGGSGKKEVEACIRDNNLLNTISLPYQPLSELRHSLSAADVHAVSLGDQMVGIVHPCKIYGAMAVGRPILYLGPSPSHVTDLLDAHDIGLRVSHGDVDGAIDAILKLKATPPPELRRMGIEGQRTLEDSISQKILIEQFCDRMEEALFAKVRATNNST